MSTNTVEAKAVDLPGRLETIENLIERAHSAVSRMRPQEGAEAEEATPGVEASANRAVRALTTLNDRLDEVANTVGQL